MKKKKLFRLLTVALTLVFLCQFAVPAFASEETYYSDTWSDGSSTYWLEAQVGSSYRRDVVTIPGTNTQHYYGSYTNFDLYYDLYIEENWQLGYYYELLEAFNGTSYNYFYRENGIEMYDLCGGIRPEDATGIYNIQTGVDYKRINYTVYQELYGTRNQWDYGQVLAPVNFDNTIVGYELA